MRRSACAYSPVADRLRGGLQEQVERVHRLAQVVGRGGEEVGLLAASGLRGDHLLFAQREQRVGLVFLIFLRGFPARNSCV